MKEPVTNFDINAAFRALDEIETPKASKRVKENLAESFKRVDRLSMLVEDYYNINNSEELAEAKEDRDADIAKAKLARIEKIVDLDAETEDDILPSYVGKTIIQCPQCMTLFYKNQEDLVSSEENPDVVNVNEPCQHCGNISGYDVIGKVAGVNEEEAAECTTEEAPAEENELDLNFDETEEGTEEEAPAEESSEEATTEETSEEDIDLDEVPEEEEKKEESLNKSTSKSLFESTKEDFEDFIDIDDFTNPQDLANYLEDNGAKIISIDGNTVRYIDRDEAQLKVSEITVNSDKSGKKESFNRPAGESLIEGVFDTVDGSYKKINERRLFKDPNGNIWIAEKDPAFGFATIRKQLTMNDPRNAPVYETPFDTKQEFLKYVKKHKLEPINNTTSIYSDELSREKLHKQKEEIGESLNESDNNLIVYDIGTDDGGFIGQVKAQNEDEAYKIACEIWPEYICTGHYLNKVYMVVIGEAEEADPKLLSDFKWYEWAKNKEIGESLNESADSDLNKKLKDHNEYIATLQDEIKKEEEAINKAKNEFIKKMHKANLESLKAALDKAIPEEVKEVEQVEELPAADEVPEEAIEGEEVKESLKEEVSPEDAKDAIKKAMYNWDDDKITEAQCKLYKAVTHDDETMKELKEDANNDFISAKGQKDPYLRLIWELMHTDATNGKKCQKPSEGKCYTEVYTLDSGKISGHIRVMNVFESKKYGYDGLAIDMNNPKYLEPAKAVASELGMPYDEKIAKNPKDKSSLFINFEAIPEVTLEPRLYQFAKYAERDAAKKAKKLQTKEESFAESYLREDEELPAEISKADIDRMLDSKEFKTPVSEAEVEAAIEATNESRAKKSVNFNNLDEINEKSLNEHFTKYLTEVYENVVSFKMTNCKLEHNNLVVEGKINFKSGRVNSTSFTFNNLLEGYNKDFSNKNAFKFTAKINNGQLIVENLKYRYKIKNSLVRGCTKK